MLILLSDTATLSFYGFIISTILIIVLAFVIYYQLLKTTNQSLSLEVQKEEIEAQRDALLKAAERFEQSQNKIEAQNRKVNEALDTFLYRVSHDIRGPLATIMGLCHLMTMDEQADVATMKDYVAKMDFLTKKMNKVLVKVANVSKVSYRNLEYQKIDIEQLIKLCLMDLEVEENFHKIHFTTQISTIDDFHTDALLLEIILISLLENAIQYLNPYAEKPPFTIIEVERDTKGNMVIAIKSNNHPIPKTVQDKIFNMFYRGSNLSQGAGLGLYICKIACEKLEGKIDLAYSDEQETAFVVTIPNREIHFRYE